MTPAEYLAGIALVVTTVVAFGLSGRRLRIWLAPTWTGGPAILANAVLALALAILTAEALGLVGLLAKAPLPIAAIAVACALTRWAPRGTDSRRPPAPPASSVALALATLAAAVTAIHWAGPVLQSLDSGIYRQDSLWYHLPFAASFAQSGSTGDLLFTDTLKLTVWYYPLNSELLHGVGMALLGNDLLSPVLNYAWMGLALLAAWCIGRPFGLAPVTLLAAVLVVDSDMMLVQSGNAPGDIVALACLLAAIAILVNGCAAQASGPSGGRRLELAIDRGPLAIAALAAGLAVGTKVTMLVPVAVITVAVLWRASGSRRAWAGIWFGGLLATGGFWYLRNFVHAGNPLPWFSPGPLPGPDQEALYPRPAHSIAEYIADRHAWTDYFLPGFGNTLGPLWFVVLFAALAGIAVGLRRRNGVLIQALALAALATLVAHVFNPISASGPLGGPYGFGSNLRYAAPGMVVGLVLLPLCETAFVVRCVLTPAFGLLALVGAVFSTEWVQPQPAAAIAFGTGAVLLAIWLARGRVGPGRIVVVGAAAAILAVAGYWQQRQYFEDRYNVDAAPALDNPGFRATPQWRLIQTWAGDQHNQRIAVFGSPAAYGQYVFYGDDLSNEVRYLGRPGPHGGYRPIESCEGWRRRIGRGHFDQVVVTPEDPGSPVPPPQLVWTALGGTALNTLPVAPASVFTITAPLDPTLCRQGVPSSRFSRPGRPLGPNMPPGAAGLPGLPDYSPRG